MSRFVSSRRAVLRFASPSEPVLGEDRTCQECRRRHEGGCKCFGEALSVASGPVFVIEKSHTLPRSRGRWNLDLSRAGVINPGNACGDDANAVPISVFAINPPAAMMLIHPSGPACVQKCTLFNARLHSRLRERTIDSPRRSRTP